MDPIFNRLYRHGDGGALDALVYARAENAGLLVRPNCLRLFGRHLLRITALPSRPPKELGLQRNYIDVCGRGRNVSAHHFQRYPFSLYDNQNFVFRDCLDPFI